MPIKAGFALFLAVSGLSSTAQAAGFRVLFTSFDPYGGNPTNNSERVVQALQNQNLGDGVQISTCNLPTLYDRAAAQAMACVSQTHPDAVVSIGEADCTLLVETAATNWDDTPGMADNAGVTRAGSVIVPGGPKRSGFGFPVQAMYCALGADTSAVDVSISTEAFVCNNTAYHLSQELPARGLPFTFIHVPNARCASSEQDPEKNARLIARMVSGAIEALRASKVAAISQANHQVIHQVIQTMPTDKPGAEAFSASLRAENAPACAQAFAKDILSDYDESD